MNYGNLGVMLQVAKVGKVGPKWGEDGLKAYGGWSWAGKARPANRLVQLLPL